MNPSVIPITSSKLELIDQVYRTLTNDLPPERYIGNCDWEARELGDSLQKSFSLFIRISAILKAETVASTKQELISIFNEHITTVSTSPPTKKSPAYLFLQRVVGITNQLEIQLFNNKNSQYLPILNIFSTIFQKYLNTIESREWGPNPLHELALAYLNKLYHNIADYLLVQSQEASSSIDVAQNILSLRAFAYTLHQNSELLLSLYPKNHTNDREFYLNAANSYLLRSDTLLEHDISARERLDILLNSLENKKFICLGDVDNALSYIDMLNNRQSEQYSQLIFSYSNRVLYLLSAPNKTLISSDKTVTNEHFNKVTEQIKTVANEHYQKYQIQLESFVKTLSSTSSYDRQTDVVRASFSKTLSAKEFSKCKNKIAPDPLYTLTKDALIIPHASKVDQTALCDRLKKTAIDIINIAEQTIQKSKEKKKKAKETAQKRKAAATKPAITTGALDPEAPSSSDPAKCFSTNSGLESCVLAGIATTTPTTDPITENPISKSLETYLQALTISSSTQKAIKQQPEEPHVLKPIKFFNTIGLSLIFTDFTFAKGSAPDAETIARFKTLCQEPKLVGPKNENGFKWVSKAKGQRPILVGKITRLAWRLFPIDMQLTPSGTIISYGLLKEVKSGKRSGRY